MKKNYQLYIQAALWIVYAFLLTVIINKTFSLSDSIIKSGTLIMIQISLFYYNSQRLFPALLSTKKTWKYLLNLLVILALLFIFFTWFERQFLPEIVEEMAPNKLNRLQERAMRGGPPRRQLLNALILFDFLSLLIVLILSSAYSAASMSRKKEQLESQKNVENLSSEMKFLKSQINPHFLFNALNNIYSLTLTGSAEASEMILKLSEMLRYILYECNDSYVSIEREWNYIQNFIDFQQLKSKDKLNLELSFTNDNPGAMISPMIFIPFIENAFKHSNIENRSGWIRIALNNKPEEIIFQVDNSVSLEKKNQDNTGGIGLDNVKRRLELVYNKQADLIINDSKESFGVLLRIKKTK
jgi:LytS/YehU family sensor histidine kinase